MLPQLDGQFNLRRGQRCVPQRFHALSFEEQQQKVVFLSPSPEAAAAKRDVQHYEQSQFNFCRQRLGFRV